jgi:outer membrane protein
MIGLTYFLVASVLAQVTPAVTQAKAAPKLTLGEAIDLADKNAFPVRIATKRRDKALEQERSALNSLGPRLDAAANWANQKTDFASSGGGGGAFGPEGWNQYKSVTLTLSQSVDINGLARKGAEGLKFQRQAEDENVQTEKAGLHADVRVRYLTLLQSIELERVQAEALRAATERLDKANIRFREGAIPRFEVLRLEADQKNTQQNLVNARGNTELARQDLNNTMGLPIETVYEPVPVDTVAVSEAAVNDMVSAAMNNRSEIRQSQFLVLALMRTRDVAYQDIKPSLNLSATHTQYFDPPAFSTQRFDQVAAKLSGPLYDSGVGRRKITAANRDIEIAQLQFEQLSLGVALSVRRAATNAFTANRSLDVAKANVAVAREALRLAQLRYDEGAGILLDVIVAQADLTAAEANLVNANYRYLQAYAQLQRAVGSDDLRPLSQTPIQVPKK